MLFFNISQNPVFELFKNVASIERTAYPRFKRYYTAKELQEIYTPKPSEIAFGRTATTGSENYLNLIVLLKSFQRLGYFPKLSDIPDRVINYIRTFLKLPQNLDFGYQYSQTLSRHKQAIRSYLQVSQFTQETNSFIREIIKESALVRDNPADLINVAIEELVKKRSELPSFATLDRLIRHERNFVNQQLFSQVISELSESDQQRLNDLLDSPTHRQRSCYNDLKKLPKKSSRNHLNDLLVHLTWLETLGDVQDLIKPLTASKIKHFAAEAKALNAGEIKDITSPKRLTLLLCLIYTAQVQTRDSLVSMFLKQMKKIQNKAKDELELIRQKNQETTEKLVSVFTNVLEVFSEPLPDSQAVAQIQGIFQPQGGVESLISDCEAVNAYKGNNHLPLLWRFYKSHRSSFFRVINVLKLASTSSDDRLIKAVEFLLQNAHRRGALLTAEVDLSFTSDIINRYHVFDLPKLWGDGTTAAADGTKYDLYEQNLLSEYHIRYGGYGGIAYHHVADTYVALFSHFISCGTWEAVYIIEGLLQNQSDIQPDTVHGDTQGQSTPVFALSYLLGINLMPRIRNWKDLTFYRPDKNTVYQHIDSLFTDTIDWDLIRIHWQDLFRVVLSIQAGKISSDILLRKLGNYSRKNRLYKAFRELGRVVRTVFLLKFISNAKLRQQITAATNKVEAYHGLVKWFFFGGDSVIASNDPEQQEKRIKYNDLIANAVIFQNVVDLTEVLLSLQREGYLLEREDVACLSPYLTSQIKRFGDYLIDMETIPPTLDEQMLLL